MRDIACAGYVAGCNTNFFAGHKLAQTIDDATGLPKATDTSGLVDTINTSMSDRLSFANDVGAKYASLLAFPMSASQYEEGGVENVMSITTRLLPWEVTSTGGGKHTSFPGGEKAFDQYRNELNLGQIHYGEDMKAVENMEFISQVGLYHSNALSAGACPARVDQSKARVLAFAGLDQQRPLLPWPVSQV